LGLGGTLIVNAQYRVKTPTMSWRVPCRWPFQEANSLDAVC
jgi:hypothetical protein